ncbi:MAG: hypothetical protein ACLP9L_09390 [Thermoguttaceae bacterium]
MIRGRYGLLIAVVLVAMLSAAAGAGVFLAYLPLPDPSVATRQQLFRWLVLRDLSKEPGETRQMILSRLDAEFEKAGDLTATIENMEDFHRQMLWHNIGVLLKPWLLSKVEQYSQLPAAQRTDYIDCFLDRAEVWSKVGSACLKNSTDGGRKDGSSVSKLVMEQIRQCSDRAAPEQRQQIRAFVAAAQARWLWRRMPSFNLFGKGA